MSLGAARTKGLRWTTVTSKLYVENTAHFFQRLLSSVVERLICNEDVVSSTLTGGSTFRHIPRRNRGL